MNFTVSIDTEEDDWGCFRRTGHRCKNLERIPAVQDIFDRFRLKPTYLVTYPVATNEGSASILRKIMDAGRCEIGSHCHPWNTPPFEEETTELNSMLCNLPEDLQYRKLEALHEAVYKGFGVEPTSFRAGRWGFGASVAENLLKLNYRVDTSVSPCCDWSEYHGPDFTDEPLGPYLISAAREGDPGRRESLVEIPPTIGFLQKNFSLCTRVTKLFKSNRTRGSHVLGLLKRMRLLNLACLSPEQSSARDMLLLSRAFVENGYGYLNMSFHSTSLLPGMSPFVRDEAAYGRVLSGIERLLDYAADQGMRFLSLSEAGGVFRAGGEAEPGRVASQQSPRGSGGDAGERSDGGRLELNVRSQ